MEASASEATIERVRDPDRIRRYALVPRSSQNGGGPEGVRRYNLARIGVSRRSALGQDRHERLERIVESDRPPKDA